MQRNIMQEMALGTTEEMKMQLYLSLVTAAKPFADAVYNDNGDVTVTTSNITTADYLSLKSAVDKCLKFTDLK